MHHDNATDAPESSCAHDRFIISEIVDIVEIIGIIAAPQISQTC